MMQREKHRIEYDTVVQRIPCSHLKEDIYDKQNEKITCELGENICKQCDQHGLSFQTIQAAHKTQYIWKYVWKYVNINVSDIT